MTVRPSNLLVLSGICCLVWGCAWQHQSKIYKVVDEYCTAEIRGDVATKFSHFTPESLNLLRGGSPGAGVTGPTLNPLSDWGLASYKFAPRNIAIRGEKAYATVAGTFVNPRHQKKSVTFTVYLKRYREPTAEGKTETVWRINEIETKRRLAEELLGKGYADLWIRQLQTQQAWQKATTPRLVLPTPGRR